MPSRTSPAQEIWFLTGSQGLYGEETLKQVADQSRQIATTLADTSGIPARVVWKPVLTDADAIRRVCLDASADDRCIGLIAWMHTFSPAKMWIAGLDALRKPLLHLHTQSNVALPWDTIDMDFMNLNQAAHGDREFGHIQARVGVPRKTVAGHVTDPVTTERIAIWARAAAARSELATLKIARFGDNMRDVAVTEGDKVEAQLRFGVSVNTYGVNDLVEVVDSADETEVTSSSRSTRTCTTWRRNCGPEATGTTPCATRPASKPACASSWKRAASGPSPPTSRTWAGCASCPGSRCSGSWPRGTASEERATGRPPSCCAP